MLYPSITRTPRPRVLAIASGGGHWVQLMRLRAAFDGAEVHYATPDLSAAEMVAPAPCHAYPDASKDNPLRLALALAQIFWLVVRLRPDVVVSTGAAGGYLAIRIARLMGARTLFIDSVANTRKLSLSGWLCLGRADRVLSQWPEVAEKTGAEFWGMVL